MLEARERVGGRVWSQRLAERRGRGDGRRVHPARQHGDPRAGRTASGSASGTRACATGGASRAAASAPRTRSWPPRSRRSSARSTDGAARRSAREFLDGLDIPAGAREAILARAEISSANSADRVAAADLGGRGAHRRRARRRASPAATSACRWRWPMSLGVGGAARLARDADRVGRASARAHRRRRARRRRLRDRRPRERPGPDRLRPAAARPAAPMRSDRSPTATRRSCSCRSAHPPAPSAVMTVPERYWTWTATGDGRSSRSPS